MWHSDCELVRVYDFKERISVELISYFLGSCLLHILQLCSVLYTVSSVHCTIYSDDNYFIGANKALGRSLLEKNVDKQCCQREATNALFVVKNAYSK